MTDRDALLKAIWDDPDDDSPRLIYADWLDEHGDPRQAEFIRLQIQFSPVSTFGEALHPTSDRQIELFRGMQKWRFGRSDWASHTVEEFTRGFCSGWSGTPGDFVRIAPNLWRLGPTSELTMEFSKRSEVNVDVAREIAGCELLQRIRVVRLWGRQLSDEWVEELLKSPFAAEWTVFSIESPLLTDRVCESLTKSALVGSKTKVDVESPRITTAGMAAIEAAFGRSSVD